MESEDGQNFNIRKKYISKNLQSDPFEILESRLIAVYIPKRKASKFRLVVSDV